MLTLPRPALAFPVTLAETLDLLGTDGADALVIAGGTDAVPNLKHGLHEPKRIVHLARVRELHFVREDAEGLHLGPLVTLTELTRLPQIQRDYAGVAKAAGLVASPQIRNMGTLGGSLCQRNRCWYYRDEHVHCLLKGGRKCYATDSIGKSIAARGRSFW